MSANDGGPAFPLIAEGHEHVLSIGLTMRDHFAGLAMQAILFHLAQGIRPTDALRMADDAYQLADAMLAARAAIATATQEEIGHG